MYELLNDYASYTPLATIVIAIIVFIKRRGKKAKSGHRSLGLYLIGFLSISVLFYIIGLIIGAEIYCIDAEYAECALGGVFVGGPISLTIAGIIYSCFWGIKGTRP